MITKINLFFLFHLVHKMTARLENEYDSSHIGQITSLSARDSGYADHTNNGQNENGYGIDINDSQHTNNLSQTGYSQGSGSGTSASTGPKPEDDRKLFVGMFLC